MKKLEIGLTRIDSDEGTTDYVTCIPQERVFTRGIPSEAIVGVLLRPLETGESITPGNFAANAPFVDLMHRVIARRGSEAPDLIAEARRLRGGTLNVIDQRTRAPQGAVPPEDILGAFEVKDGQIVPGSYRPNQQHYLFSPDGFFKLGTQLEDCLAEALAAIPDPPDSDDKFEPGGGPRLIN